LTKWDSDTTVLLVGSLGTAVHIAHSHMNPPWLALVHPKTGTPINATLLITISSAFIAFFTSFGCAIKFVISKYAFHYRDDIDCSFGEKVLC
jgi:amino acid transporter